MGDIDTHANGNGGLKGQAARWLFSQGASTVLLFLICAGLWVGVPWYVNKHEAERKEMREDARVTQKEFRDSLKEQRSDFINTLKEIEGVK